MTGRSYCLISPCRDEARYARRTLESVVHQTEPPALWIIVDDGSTDATPQILAEYAERYRWIQIVRRANRGQRKVGGGVIDAFYAGYDCIDPLRYDFICKLDLDLDLPPGYFAGLIDRMAAQPRMGTCSGRPYFFSSETPDNAVTFPLAPSRRLVSEMTGDENSCGMTKFYRLVCFQQIGGFVREVMWDGIDGHRCRQKGWIAASWDEPELRFLHLRPMGTSHKSWWTGRVRHGFGQYFMGTTPIYMVASALFRMPRPPRIVGGLGMMYGYLQALLRHKTRYDDAQFRAFLRRYQWACLLKGKRQATADLNARQAAVWNPRRH